jgi:hypothetical protein
MTDTKNHTSQPEGQDSYFPVKTEQGELTPRMIRGWKGLRAPNTESLARAHRSSARAGREKRAAAKLDEVLGTEEDEL